jgi:hypothetical protein
MKYERFYGLMSDGHPLENPSYDLTLRNIYEKVKRLRLSDKDVIRYREIFWAGISVDKTEHLLRKNRIQACF